MQNVLWACAFVLACMGFYQFIWPALKRFDRNNVARIHQQDRDKADANAHFRHALEVADEQVEAVQEIKVAGGTQYPFLRRTSHRPDRAQRSALTPVGARARVPALEKDYSLAIPGCHGPQMRAVT
jgi:hypothetical protein